MNHPIGKSVIITLTPQKVKNILLDLFLLSLCLLVPSSLFLLYHVLFSPHWSISHQWVQSTTQVWYSFVGGFLYSQHHEIVWSFYKLDATCWSWNSIIFHILYLMYSLPSWNLLVAQTDPVKWSVYEFNVLSDNKDELDVINVNLPRYFKAPHL